MRREELRVVLIEAAPRILTAFDPPLSDKARQQLQDLGVEVRSGVRVENVDASGVRVAGELIEARTVLWGAGVQPSPLAKTLGVPLDRAGRVLVAPDCSVPGHPEAFVIGDMAALTPEGATAPLPGISPVAIQEGRAVARSILGFHARRTPQAVPLPGQGIHGDDRPRAGRRPDPPLAPVRAWSPG